MLPALEKREMVTLIDRPGVILVKASYYQNKRPNYLIILWRQGYKEMDSLALQVSFVLLHKYTDDILPPDPVLQIVGTCVIKDKLLDEWRQYSSDTYSETTWISIHNQPDRSWYVTCGYN